MAILGLIILTILFWGLGIAFRHGKLLFLIAGNNAARKPYDQKSLFAGRIVGLIMHVAGILTALIAIPNIPEIYYLGATIGFIIFLIIASVYLNKQIGKMD
ncbi:DUF3784 domain-containing protein [Lentilactobacillus raoultii]|uniref:DUF3784 domain-containing protein n=1 Tax=Lentilactobacillus raoultii TaxID=1987503 RepID=A0ABW3PLD4_9LACO|nr:DUF3784 domain-containing protein [Lentilactobacillus raoultii]